jgi:HEPN domain-containing protein
MARADLEMVRLTAAKQVSSTACRSKLAEVVEKTMKAELIRLGWTLERTHDLERLLDELVARRSDLVPNLETLCDSLADAYFSDRYPGFDLEDPDWPLLNEQVEAVTKLLTTVESRIAGKTT